MNIEVPPLESKPPGLGLRALGLVLSGVRRVSAQVEPYTAWWNERNEQAMADDGPLLVVVGDSTAIGIGASSPDLGYVSLLRAALSKRDSATWRVINLGQSGARTEDAVERQLPIATQLAGELTLCCVGTNDVVWSGDTGGPRRRLRTLIAELPTPMVIGTVAGGSLRARLVNRAIRDAVGGRGVTIVEPWGESGASPRERLAADRFHPNDLGYELMARRFARVLGAPEPSNFD